MNADEVVMQHMNGDRMGMVLGVRSKIGRQLGEDVFIFGQSFPYFGAMAGQDTIKDFGAGDLLDLSAWFYSPEALPDSWRDGLQAGDLGVSAGKRSLVIDLAADTGVDPGAHVVTLLGIDRLEVASLIVWAPTVQAPL